MRGAFIRGGAAWCEGADWRRSDRCCAQQEEPKAEAANANNPARAALRRLVLAHRIVLNAFIVFP